MFRVPPAPAPYLSKVRLCVRMDKNRIKHSSFYVLHGFEDNRVVSHAEVIVGAPNLDLILDILGVGKWEFVRKPINIVEVAVRLVLVLLLELCCEKMVVVEDAFVRLWRVNGYWSSSNMEGTAGCLDMNSSRSGSPR